MADTYIRLIQRRDTAANWQTENPVLMLANGVMKPIQRKLRLVMVQQHGMPYHTLQTVAVLSTIVAMV